MGCDSTSVVLVDDTTRHPAVSGNDDWTIPQQVDNGN
jgi:hypothetical protein